MIRPNNLTLAPRIGYIRSPLLPDEIGSMLHLEPQVPRGYMWQVHNSHLFEIATEQPIVRLS